MYSGIENSIETGVEITSSVYAVYHRGDLQRTGTGRRIADDVRVPQFHAEWDFPAEENVMEHVKEITRGIRNMRAEMNVPNNRKTKVYVVCEDTEICDGISTLENSIKPLMMAEKILVQQTKENIADNAVSVVVPDAVVYLPLEDLVDFEQEMERLQKEEEKLKKEIKRAEGMLSNERFISKAPEAKVQEEREKLEKYTQMLQQVQERMAGLKK